MRDIKTFREDEVIHCTTAEESAVIWKLLDGIGKGTHIDMWGDPHFKTKGFCYSYRGFADTFDFYKALMYTIIPAKEFMENNTTITTEDELLLL